MKLYLTLLTTFLALSLCWQEVSAQTDPMPQYLLEEGVQLSGFGGPVLGLSSLEDEMVPSIGAAVALLMDQKFFVGGYGMSTNKLVKKTFPEFQEVSLGFVHTGLWMGYIYPVNRIAQVGFSMKIGGGKLTLREGDTFTSLPEKKQNIDEDALTVLTPAVDLEFNIAPWMKATLGVGYRFVSGLDTDYFTQSDLRSLEGNLGLYFRLIQSEKSELMDEKIFPDNNFNLNTIK